MTSQEIENLIEKINRPEYYTVIKFLAREKSLEEQEVTKSLFNNSERAQKIINELIEEDLIKRKIVNGRRIIETNGLEDNLLDLEIALRQNIMIDKQGENYVERLKEMLDKELERLEDRKQAKNSQTTKMKINDFKEFVENKKIGLDKKEKNSVSKRTNNCGIIPLLNTSYNEGYVETSSRRKHLKALNKTVELINNC